MIQAGDIHLTHLNDEVRRRVLVLSNARFNSMSGRVIVAPEVPVDPDEILFPWMVAIDAAIYSIDLMRSVPTNRLLKRTDRAPSAAMAAARRALLNIT